MDQVSSKIFLVEFSRCLPVFERLALERKYSDTVMVYIFNATVLEWNNLLSGHPRRNAKWPVIELIGKVSEKPINKGSSEMRKIRDRHVVFLNANTLRGLGELLYIINISHWLVFDMISADILREAQEKYKQ